MRTPALFLWLVLAPLPAWSAELITEISDDLRSAQIVADTASGEPLRLAPALSGFYSARADVPGWVDDSGPLPAAEEMLDVIRDSAQDGLDPSDYHLQALENLFTTIRSPILSSESRRRRLAAMELLLSDAFLLLGEHELNGRVNPVELDPMLTGSSRDLDIAALLDHVMSGASPATELHALLPQDADYLALREALMRYRLLEVDGQPPPVVDGPSLHADDKGPRVAALIVRLKFEGDLGPDSSLDDSYDPAVTAAVAHFQERHGLGGAGIADTATLALLNEPLRAVIDRIRVNLERRRWLSRYSAPTRIEVNIADFRATLYEDGKPVLSAPAVVGEPYRQTPEFSDHIRYLVINPAWDVPPTIAGEDLLPKAQKDPDYFTKHGYQVLQGWNAAERVVDSHAIDWTQWNADTLPYRLRQLPGPENALGKVKFMFPNRFGVYLHDTPAQGLFAAQTRTFSSGCIRVAHALDLAVELLRLDGQANPGQLLRQALAAGVTRNIDFAQPVPIDIVYMTVWVDDLGVVQFRPDVYGRDSEILHALDAPLSANTP